MGAPGAEVGQSLDRVARVGQESGWREVDDAVAPVELREMARQPGGHLLDEARGPQLAGVRDERRALRVVLAEDRRAGRFVVEQVAQLRLDDVGFLFHHQHFGEALREGLQPRGLDGVGEAQLVEPHAGVGQCLQRDVEAAEDLHQVVVRLAGTDDAHLCVRRRAPHRACDAGAARS